MGARTTRHSSGSGHRTETVWYARVARLSGHAQPTNRLRAGWQAELSLKRRVHPRISPQVRRTLKSRALDSQAFPVGYSPCISNPGNTARTTRVASRPYCEMPAREVTSMPAESPKARPQHLACKRTSKRSKPPTGDISVITYASRRVASHQSSPNPEHTSDVSAREDWWSQRESNPCLQGENLTS